MTSHQIVRAWKDADYGATLSLSEASSVPAHPVGGIQLADAELGLVAGGYEEGTQWLETLGCCKGITEYGKCDLTAGPAGGCTMWCFTIIWTAI